MVSNSNIDREGIKYYSYRTSDTYNDIRARAARFSSVIETTALQCNSCGEVVVAEYNLGTRKIEVFEYDPYIAKDARKVVHSHAAGPIMRKRIESRIAIETRMLHSFNENDFRILTQGERGIN